MNKKDTTHGVVRNKEDMGENRVKSKEKEEYEEVEFRNCKEGNSRKDVEGKKENKKKRREDKEDI